MEIPRVLDPAPVVLSMAFSTAQGILGISLMHSILKQARLTSKLFQDALM